MSLSKALDFYDKIRKCRSEEELAVVRKEIGEYFKVDTAFCSEWREWLGAMRDGKLLELKSKPVTEGDFNKKGKELFNKGEL